MTAFVKKEGVCIVGKEWQYMQTLKQTNVNQYIAEESSKNNIDFVAFVMSPFHALGVDAFIYDTFKKKGKILNGLIFVTPKSNTYWVKESNLLCLKFANIQLIYLETSGPINSIYLVKTVISILKGFLQTTTEGKDQKRSLYIINPRYIPFESFHLFEHKEIKKKYSIKFVIIDEGVGSYIDLKALDIIRKNEMDVEGVNKKSHIKNTITKFIPYISKYSMKYLTNVEDRKIFIQKSGKLIPNNSSIEAYKNVLTFGKKEIPEIILPFVKNNWAIIATQPFVDYGQINSVDYLFIIKKTINILIENNFKVMLKPHPREKEELYESLLKEKQVFVLPKSEILENVLPFNPSVIIGITTTTLITSNIFYNVPSISLSNILNKYSNNVALNVSIEQFEGKFFEFVYFPSSYTQLITILDKIKKDS